MTCLHYISIRWYALNIIAYFFTDSKFIIWKSFTPYVHATAQTMVDLSKDKTSLDDFAVNMHSQLGEFEFPDEFIGDVWSSIQTAKTVAASKAAAAANTS